MKKIVLTYGILAGAINAGMAYALTTVFGDELMHANAEWVGYTVMIIALAMIFVGVKQYRDRELGGVIKFGRAFLVGLYIALVASVIYVGVWEIYMNTEGEDFIEEYTSSYITQMEEDGATPAEIKEVEAEMDYYKEIYRKPLLRMLVTLSEILPVGLIIALISAAVLRNNKLIPPERPTGTTDPEGPKTP